MFYRCENPSQNGRCYLITLSTEPQAFCHLGLQFTRDTSLSVNQKIVNQLIVHLATPSILHQALKKLCCQNPSGSQGWGRGMEVGVVWGGCGLEQGVIHLLTQSYNNPFSAPNSKTSLVAQTVKRLSTVFLCSQLCSWAHELALPS